MIQIDGPKIHVYIKFQNTDILQRIINNANGQQEYKHENGEISKVQIEHAGMGIRTLRIANLPPEVPNSTISNTLTKYGEIKDIREETWAQSYRYPVANGIRLVKSTYETIYLLS
jgi:hypothetical protein